MSQQDFWKDNLWPTDPVTGETIVGLPGTTALVIPIGTTAERPASPIAGQLRYNTDIGDYEAYNGGWAILATVAGVTLSKLEDADLNTQIFVENFTGVDDNIIAFTLGDNSGAYTVPASVLNFSTSGFNIQTPSGSAANAGVGVSILAGNGHTAAMGGSIIVNAGNGGATGDGGVISLYAGSGGLTSGDGGNFVITAGNTLSDTAGGLYLNGGPGGGAGTGGPVNITAGAAGIGGDVSITGGIGTAGAGGDVTISGGTSVGTVGSSISIIGGDGDGASNDGGDISMTAGQGDASNGDGGDITITSGAGGTSSGAGGNLNLNAGEPTTDGVGGSVNINAGDALGIAVGGTVTISGGDGGDISGVGGAVLINAGAGGTGDIGGTIAFTAGDGDGSSNGGPLSMLSGAGGGGGGDDGGDINITSGIGTNKAGDITLTGGNSAGTGGSITLRAGTGSTDGNLVFITSGTSQMSVEPDGTLILASGYTAKVTSFGSTNILTDKGYVDQEIAAVVTPSPISGSMGVPVPGSWVLHFPVVAPMTVAGSGHLAFCNPTTAASVSGASFDIFHISPGGSAPGAPVGTITFAIGAGTGVVTLPLTALAAGDALVVVYASPDTGGTLANVGFTFVATTP